MHGRQSEVINILQKWRGFLKRGDETSKSVGAWKIGSEVTWSDDLGWNVLSWILCLLNHASL